MILGSFFYGYIITQLPGGEWSNRTVAHLQSSVVISRRSVVELATQLKISCDYL